MKLDMVSDRDQLLRSLAPEAAALGVPEQIHPVRPSVLWACRFAAVACLAGAALLLCVLSEAVLAAGGRPHGMLVAGTVLLVATLVLSGLAFSLRTFGYLVFREALVQTCGGRCTIFRWEAIKEVLEQPIGARARFRIVLEDGRTRPIVPVVKNQKALGRMIAARVSERVGPQTLQLLAMGGTVSLGRLSICAERAAGTDEERPGRIARLDHRRQLAREKRTRGYLVPDGLDASNE